MPELITLTEPESYTSVTLTDRHIILRQKIEDQTHTIYLTHKNAINLSKVINENVIENNRQGLP